MRTDFFNLAFLAILLTGAHASNSAKFYVTEPACQNEGCTVTVQAGSSLHINWLNPVKGKINIRLVPEESNKNAKTVKIATNIGAHINSKSCDRYDAKSCGAFSWAVPKTVKAGQYSIDIHSLTDKSVHGYSDIITIASAAPTSSSAANNTNNDNVAPSNNQTDQAGSDPTTSNSPNKAYTAMGRPDSRRVLVKRSADRTNKTETKKEHDDEKHHRKHHHHKNATLAVEHEHHKNKTVHEKHHHRHNGTHHHHHNGTRKDASDKKKKHHGKGKKDHKKTKKDNSTEDVQKTDSSMSERDVTLTKLL